MKKWFLVAAIAATAVSGLAQAKDWKSVRFATEGAYPPFNYTNSDGTLGGFDVDLANAICKEMQAKCQVVPQDWDGIIPALLARKYDAIIAGMSITEERKKKVAFTHKYALIPNKFIAKKGADIKFTKEGLKGVKIGVQRSTTHDQYIEDNYKDIVDVVRYGTFDEAYLDLESGRIDAVFGDASALQSGMLDKVEGYEFTGQSLTDEKWFGDGFGIAVRKQDQDLADQINKAIDALRAKGIYQQIAAKYFSYDVYGK
ncbi:ABC transporter substrate-binding protein [Vibrio hibernica]|uniref:ABC transporter substrate-binding protein n=1 Tax=Vibrio hibernica TaxID=2587465 RepID=UPI001881C06B|nr:ABC transporter substrate-binding protein [Vibrio hibernica]